jgi:hypothetical protein
MIPVQTLDPYQQSTSSIYLAIQAQGRLFPDHAVGKWIWHSQYLTVQYLTRATGYEGQTRNATTIRARW